MQILQNKKIHPAEIHIRKPEAENIGIAPESKHLIIWFLLCFAGVLLSFKVSEINHGTPRFWLLTPLIAGIISQIQYKQWPIALGTMFVGGILCAPFVVNEHQMNLVWNVSLSIPTGLMMSILIQMVYHKKNTEFNALNTLLSVFLCSLIPTVVSSSIATFFGGDKPYETWGAWYLSQILGTTIILPISLAFKWDEFKKSSDIAQLVRSTVLFSVGIIMSFQSFKSIQEPYFFLIAPLVLGSIILTLNYSLIVSSALVLFVASYVSLHTDQEYSPLTNLPLIYLAVTGSLLSILLNSMRLEKSRLQSSETKFKDAMRFSPIGMALTSIDGRFALINESMCRMTGYDGRDMNIRKLLDLISEPQRQAVSEGLMSLINGDDNVMRKDVKIIHKSGSHIAANIAASVMRKNSGEPVGLVVQIEDLNEMELARDALNKSEERFEFAVNCSDIGVWDADLRSGKAYFSKKCQEILNCSESEAIENMMDVIKNIHPKDEDAAKDDVHSHLLGMTDMFEIEHRTNDETSDVWLLSRGKIIEKNEDGTPFRMVGTVTDITGQKNNALILERLNERMKLAAGAARIGVWEWSFENNQMTWDDQMYDLFGVSQNEFTPNTENWDSFIHHEDRDKARKALENAISNQNEDFDLEVRYIRKGEAEDIRYARSILAIVRKKNGDISHIVGAFWDNTEKTILQANLREERNRLIVSLNAIADAVITTDEKGRVNFMNPSAKIMMGIDNHNNPNIDIFSLFTLKDDAGRPLSTNPVREGLNQKENRTIIYPTNDISLTNIHGETFDVEITVSPMIGDLGFVGTLVAVHDVTHAKEMQRRLAHAASHDALTGLYNRSHFETEMQRNLDKARAEDLEHVICFVDLDKFKIVNDSAGHSVGDILLKNISKQISQEVRNSDILARIGGDEFGILLLNCNLAQAELVAQKIIENISLTRFTWGGNIYDVGASIGLVSLNSRSKSIADVMSQADVACYAAKHAGRNRCSVYEDSQNEAQKQHKEILLAAGLRDAIENNRLVLYAQRIKGIQGVQDDDLQNPPRNHYELLLRMRDRNGIMIPPGAFIPAAERFELMGMIDRWVVETALKSFGQRISEIPGFSMAINISANSLSDETFLDFLLKTLKDSPVSPKSIVFEVTETSIMNHVSVASDTLSRMRELGCKVALDDFGSGLSSYTYLKNFKVDVIKIDGGFVKHVNKNVVDWTIVDSMNQVAHRLGAETVAEFVENGTILDECRRIGIDYVQGYSVHKPTPLENLLEELEKQSKVLIA